MMGSLKICCVCGKDWNAPSDIIDTVYPDSRDFSVWKVICQLHNAGCGRVVYGDDKKDAVRRWNKGKTDEMETWQATDQPKNLKQALDDIRGDLSPLRKDGNLYDELVDLRTDERRAAMSKHTPGPWFSWGAGGTDYTVISSNKGEEVVGVSEWIRAEDEDLRLMAAAPELLEALEKCVFLLGSIGHRPNNSATAMVAFDAIAKAKGEQE